MPWSCLDVVPGSETPAAPPLAAAAVQAWLWRVQAMLPPHAPPSHPSSPDLKPENWLLKRSESSVHPENLRAVDFGLSTFHHPTAPCTERVGSSYYVAPEVLQVRTWVGVRKGRVQIACGRPCPAVLVLHQACLRSLAWGSRLPRSAVVRPLRPASPSPAAQLRPCVLAHALLSCGCRLKADLSTPSAGRSSRHVEAPSPPFTP